MAIDSTSSASSTSTLRNQSLQQINQDDSKVTQDSQEGQNISTLDAKESDSTAPLSLFDGSNFDAGGVDGSAESLSLLGSSKGTGVMSLDDLVPVQSGQGDNNFSGAEIQEAMTAAASVLQGSTTYAPKIARSSSSDVAAMVSATGLQAANTSDSLMVSTEGQLSTAWGFNMPSVNSVSLLIANYMNPLRSSDTFQTLQDIASSQADTYRSAAQALVGQVSSLMESLQSGENSLQIANNDVDAAQYATPDTNSAGYIGGMVGCVVLSIVIGLFTFGIGGVAVGIGTGVAFNQEQEKEAQASATVKANQEVADATATISKAQANLNINKQEGSRLSTTEDLNQSTQQTYTDMESAVYSNTQQVLQLVIQLNQMTFNNANRINSELGQMSNA